MTMGKHRALDVPVEELDYDNSVYQERKPGRLVKVWTEYCQPFYKRYRKSLVAAAGAAFTTLLAVYTDGITRDELMFILIQVGAAAGVWRFPNATNKKVVKTDDQVQ